MLMRLLGIEERIWIGGNAIQIVRLRDPDQSNPSTRGLIQLGIEAPRSLVIEREASAALLEQFKRTGKRCPFCGE